MNFDSSDPFAHRSGTSSRTSGDQGENGQDLSNGGGSQGQNAGRSNGEAMDFEASNDMALLDTSVNMNRPAGDDNEEAAIPDASAAATTKKRRAGAKAKGRAVPQLLPPRSEIGMVLKPSNRRFAYGRARNATEQNRETRPESIIPSDDEEEFNVYNRILSTGFQRADFSDHLGRAEDEYIRTLLAYEALQDPHFIRADWYRPLRAQERIFADPNMLDNRWYTDLSQFGLHVTTLYAHWPAPFYAPRFERFRLSDSRHVYSMSPFDEDLAFKITHKLPHRIYRGSMLVYEKKRKMWKKGREDIAIHRANANRRKREAIIEKAELAKFEELRVKKLLEERERLLAEGSDSNDDDYDDFIDEFDFVDTRGHSGDESEESEEEGEEGEGADAGNALDRSTVSSRAENPEEPESLFTWHFYDINHGGHWGGYSLVKPPGRPHQPEISLDPVTVARLAARFRHPFVNNSGVLIIGEGNRKDRDYADPGAEPVNDVAYGWKKPPKMIYDEDEKAKADELRILEYKRRFHKPKEAPALPQDAASLVILSAALSSAAASAAAMPAPSTATSSLVATSSSAPVVQAPSNTSQPKELFWSNATNLEEIILLDDDLQLDLQQQRLDAAQATSSAASGTATPATKGKEGYSAQAGFGANGGRTSAVTAKTASFATSSTTNNTLLLSQARKSSAHLSVTAAHSANIDYQDFSEHESDFEWSEDEDFPLSTAVTPDLATKKKKRRKKVSHAPAPFIPEHRRLAIEFDKKHGLNRLQLPLPSEDLDNLDAQSSDEEAYDEIPLVRSLMPSKGIIAEEMGPEYTGIVDDEYEGNDILGGRFRAYYAPIVDTEEKSKILDHFHGRLETLAQPSSGVGISKNRSRDQERDLDGPGLRRSATQKNSEVSDLESSRFEDPDSDSSELEPQPFGEDGPRSNKNREGIVLPDHETKHNAFVDAFLKEAFPAALEAFQLDPTDLTSDLQTLKDYTSISHSLSAVVEDTWQKLLEHYTREERKKRRLEASAEYRQKVQEWEEEQRSQQEERQRLQEEQERLQQSRWAQIRQQMESARVATTDIAEQRRAADEEWKRAIGDASAEAQADLRKLRGEGLRQSVANLLGLEPSVASLASASAQNQQQRSGLDSMGPERMDVAQEEDQEGESPLFQAEKSQRHKISASSGTSAMVSAFSQPLVSHLAASQQNRMDLDANTASVPTEPVANRRDENEDPFGLEIPQTPLQRATSAPPSTTHTLSGFGEDTQRWKRKYVPMKDKPRNRWLASRGETPYDPELPSVSHFVANDLRPLLHPMVISRATHEVMVADAAGFLTNFMNAILEQAEAVYVARWMKRQVEVAIDPSCVTNPIPWLTTTDRFHHSILDELLGLGVSQSFFRKIQRKTELIYDDEAFQALWPVGHQDVSSTNSRSDNMAYSAFLRTIDPIYPPRSVLPYLIRKDAKNRTNTQSTATGQKSGAPTDSSPSTAAASSSAPTSKASVQQQEQFKYKKRKGRTHRPQVIATLDPEKANLSDWFYLPMLDPNTAHLPNAVPSLLPTLEGTNFAPPPDYLVSMTNQQRQAYYDIGRMSNEFTMEDASLFLHPGFVKKYEHLLTAYLKKLHGVNPPIDPETGEVETGGGSDSERASSGESDDSQSENGDDGSETKKNKKRKRAQKTPVTPVKKKKGRPRGPNYKPKWNPEDGTPKPRRGRPQGTFKGLRAIKKSGASFAVDEEWEHQQSRMDTD